MADQQQMLPSSQGGIVRYDSDYKSKIRIKPVHVIVLTVVVVIIELFLHSTGG